MTVKMTMKDGTVKDVTQLLISYDWSGSKTQCARELELTMAVSETDGNLPTVDCPLWTPVALYGEDGAALLTGYVVYRKRISGKSTMAIRCMDRGIYLSNNQGWYSFSCTPEQAAATVCADFGVTVGTLAAAGVEIDRKFPGVALHKIINTMYTKASDSTGKKYMIRFSGNGTLDVIQKPTAASATLAPGVNILSSTIAEDGSDYCNSVAIYSEDGARIRTLGNEAAQKLAGLMQRAVTQRDDEDASDEANTMLEDYDIQQTVTVECLGDTALITGEAVTVQQTASGVKGLFWIDSDTHTWKNGQYTCTLSLNFRNLMDDTTAGTEVEV